MLYVCLFPDQQISIMLQQKVALAFESFTEKILKSFNLNPELASLPIKVSFHRINAIFLCARIYSCVSLNLS